MSCIEGVVQYFLSFSACYDSFLSVKIFGVCI